MKQNPAESGVHYKKPRNRLLSLSLELFNFSIPRLFGLLSATYNSRAKRLEPSWRWLLFSNLIGHTFICIYPIAVVEIIQYRTSPDGDDSGIKRKIEILQLVMMYLLSVGVFVRQMYFSKHQISVVNRGMKFYQRCQTLCGDDINIVEYSLPYIFRAICSFIGYAMLSVLTICYFYGDLSQVHFIYKIAFFMPNIVITTTTIRFHSAIIMLSVGGRRINQAFCDCIESVNRTAKQPRTKQQRACQLATERFEYIVTFHAEWYAIANNMQKSLTVLMLFIVTNNVISLTSTVSIYIFVAKTKKSNPIS